MITYLKACSWVAAFLGIKRTFNGYALCLGAGYTRIVDTRRRSGYSELECTRLVLATEHKP